MAFMISIEDLVANALIQNLTINEDKRFLTYSEIESYGAKVVKILIDENEEAVLLLSRLKTNQMLHDYSEFFEEKNITSIAITDSNLFGMMEFYKKCKEKDIKVCVTLNSNLDKKKLEKIVDYVVEE